MNKFALLHQGRPALLAFSLLCVAAMPTYTWAQSDSNKDATPAAKPADKTAATDKDAKAVR